LYLMSADSILVASPLFSSPNLVTAADDDTSSYIAFEHNEMQVAKEAMVFIHGFNYSISTACKKLVQVSMLGGLGAHIVPFIFSWSSGTAWSAFGSLGEVKVQAVAYGEHLAEFLSGLSRHFSRIHILTHSMGALLLFHNFQELERCFKPRRSHGAAGQMKSPLGSNPLAELSTVTLMNPDVLMEDVFHILPRILMYAERFTAYSDRHDRVLLLDWLYQRIAPRKMQTWRPLLEDDEDQDSVMLGADAAPLWLEKQPDGRTSLRKGFAVPNGIPNMLRRRIEGTARKNYRWDGEAASVMEKNPEAFAQIDVVDTTTIDTHVGFDRHNYYGLNPLIVQDVCELISSRLPACKRVRLTRTYCNVYRFRTLPFNAG